jgi:hypothetical protein
MTITSVSVPFGETAIDLTVGMQQGYKIGEAFTMSLDIILAASRGR